MRDAQSGIDILCAEYAICIRADTPPEVVALFGPLIHASCEGCGAPILASVAIRARPLCPGCYNNKAHELIPIPIRDLNPGGGHC